MFPYIPNSAVYLSQQEEVSFAVSNVLFPSYSHIHIWHVGLLCTWIWTEKCTCCFLQVSVCEYRFHIEPRKDDRSNNPQNHFGSQIGFPFPMSHFGCQRNNRCHCYWQSPWHKVSAHLCAPFRRCLFPKIFEQFLQGRRLAILPPRFVFIGVQTLLENF